LVGVNFARDFPDGFTWRDGERIVRFGGDAMSGARELLRQQGWERYELLSTPRAMASASVELAGDASDTHEVRPGRVPEVAAELLEDVRTPTLVALGGGRVIDTAKAIAAVRGGRVCAIPTTLSGAPMTAIHRLPDGHTAPHLVRPALVAAEPELMTAQPDAQMRASAMNALAHGADSMYTPLANPVSRMTALEGARLIAGALEQDAAERDRSALALGALLCAHAMDSALFAIHHVVCQTLVMTLGTPHAETNAAMLPRTMEAMRERAPEAISALAEALGTIPGDLGVRIERLGDGPRYLSQLGADGSRLEAALDAILERPQLAFTPDPPDREELRRIIAAAW
jgi:maleylacetate reductase